MVFASLLLGFLLAAGVSNGVFGVSSSQTPAGKDVGPPSLPVPALWLNYSLGDRLEKL